MMRKRLRTPSFVLIAVLAASPLLAASVKETPYTLSKAGSDLKTTLLSPFHWDKEDWLTFSAVAATGVILAFSDQGIRDRVQRNRTVGSDDFFRTMSHFGDGENLVGFVAGLYAAGAVSGSRGVKNTALLCLESYIVSSLLTDVFKLIPGRSRPYTEEGSARFRPFSYTSSHTSLPSGHSSAVWSIATVIADRTDNVFVDIACYGTAALTAVSRIQQDKHWASDVLLGSAIGYFTAKKICALNRNPNGPRLSAAFNLAGGRRGLTLSLAF
jgi:membrane-associated phospholipid phosphatase